LSIWKPYQEGSEELRTSGGFECQGHLKKGQFEVCLQDLTHNEPRYACRKEEHIKASGGFLAVGRECLVGAKYGGWVWLWEPGAKKALKKFSAEVATCYHEDEEVIPIEPI
jgi:hypothetical protein